MKLNRKPIIGERVYYYESGKKFTGNVLKFNEQYALVTDPVAWPWSGFAIDLERLHMTTKK